MYLKDEDEADASITPPFVQRRRLKIGTLKINAHGTVLGQRFISIALSKMIEEGFDEAYVTFFPHQDALKDLFEKFGFRIWGTKENGELVYIKTTSVAHDIYKDFPRFSVQGNRKFLLAIYPEYHTKLFPDSRLNTETTHVVEDLSFTNTIEKIYLSSAESVREFTEGDLILIYRTKDPKDERAAEYISVVSSICTVVEVKDIKSFSDEAEFLRYCGKGSIFTGAELARFWKSRRYPYIIKMLYNMPLKSRITRHDLIEEIGFDRDARWTCFEINDNQFLQVLAKGAVNESFVID